VIILPQDLNIKDYHAYNAITSSKLRQFIQSPETYKDRLNGTHPDCHKTGGRHYIIGQVFEDMITLSTEELQEMYFFCKGGEPEKPSERVINAKKPSTESVTKIRDWKKFLSRVGDRNVITTQECNMLQKMLDAYYKNATATQMWLTMEKQITIRKEHRGYQLQCRFDGLNTKLHTACDLKTTSKPLEDFNKAIYDYRYDLQLAYYSELYRMQFREELKDFSFIVVETIYPYRCQVMTLPRLIRESSKHIVVEGVTQMIDCLNSNEYPEFAETSKINLSQWQLSGMGYEEE